MALQKVGEQALEAVKATEPVAGSSKPKKTILDEDAYTQDLEKIIKRDFFPDLAKLEAQAEYLDAVQRNDRVKLREIHIKYGPKRSRLVTPNLYGTPATFETPEHGVGETPKSISGDSVNTPVQNSEIEHPTHNPEKKQKQEKKPSDLSLDNYLAKHTSEDNASFEEIEELNAEKHRIKHAWLFKEEEEKGKDVRAQLPLPSIEEQAAIEGGKELTSWTYKNMNAVMYIPDGVEASSKEKIEAQKKKPREIVHINTRFQHQPFNAQKSQDSIIQAATDRAASQQGKIGVDGKEVHPQESPNVNGYTFVGTPSPAPGVDASPFMTWGEIEGTPFRLDASDTPINATSGPQFRIPQVPKRDQIAFDLAEKASKAHRAKKQEAIKQVRSHLYSPSPKFSSRRSTERLKSMSPAAQRLASSRLGIRANTDKSLRASYTPSPVRTPLDKTPTPTGTPSSTPGKTPLGMVKLKDGSSKSQPSKRIVTPTSVTDDLLQLPKRAKALDYF